ncbi:MAG: phage tail family protein [Clostridia bacterium]|nr:phage tail family protein [Clostridia bacterium]
MNDWFEWNGVRCTEYGIYVSEQPPITLPQERSTQAKIPGRPGSLTTLEGDDVYDDLTLTATCFIRDPERIPAIAGWLKGGGTVTFANRPGGFYHARIANQIPFEKILRGNPHCSFAVNFRCSPPFWYVSNPDEVTITTSSAVVVNPGSVYSEPIIRVYGSGDFTLIVNDTFIELEGIENGIVLNSVIQEAYQGETLLNEKMEGDFPVLKPGNNLISWSGDVSRLVIVPNWRYL